MLYRKLLLTGLSLLLTGCFHIYQPDIEQGNVVNDDMIKQVKIGMTQEQITQIMGEPVLQNTFSNNRLNYIYAFQAGKGKNRAMTIKRMTLMFQRGKLINVVTTP